MFNFPVMMTRGGWGLGGGESVNVAVNIGGSALFLFNLGGAVKFSTGL